MFVHTLRYVREEALKEVSRVRFISSFETQIIFYREAPCNLLLPSAQAVPDGITRNQVHWVLTIPAIWRVRATRMKRAILFLA